MEIKQNIAYHCATKELAEKFFKEAEQQGIPISKAFYKRCASSRYYYTFEYDCLHANLKKDISCEIVEYADEEDSHIDNNAKVETAWVIKYNDENCFSFAGNSFTKNLCIASIYECESQALEVINYYELQNCKPVKIEIKVVENYGNRQNLFM